MFIFIVALICVVIFLSVIPLKNIKFHVTEASLTQFDITSGTDTLHYSLAVNISVRNSNKNMGIWYDRMESGTTCYGKDIGLVSLAPFRQGHKNTTLLHVVFHGNTSLRLQGSDLMDFNNDQRNESYSIFINLHGLLRLKWPGGGRSRRYHYKARCGLLRLPLINSSSTSQTVIASLHLNKTCKVSVY
ncbi:hypothetical protein MKW94_001751 [Papaver nudicaule]|uniref:Late embryogenesis abundant protein LEA-2 subgroup domain-containing protein n=1 Tax=Papaver nudicaule TaxID=74823 RepID=A0AA41SA53_PAPNU|nr:hypothetical protein [Papaver nudicaule]